MKLFCGYDARQAIGLHVFNQSLIETSPGVAAVPLHSGGEFGDASTAFTYDRFRIPELMNWGGWALWVDGTDMLCRADLNEIFALHNSLYAVQVVKHDYKTKHPRKFVGTEMEAPNPDYPRKNWSSVILWNCAHIAHFRARNELRYGRGELHRFPWLKNDQIGDLPVEWNWLADEYGENPKAKLLHWTAGIPGMFQYIHAPHAWEWHETRKRACRCAGSDG